MGEELQHKKKKKKKTKEKRANLLVLLLSDTALERYKTDGKTTRRRAKRGQHRTSFHPAVSLSFSNYHCGKTETNDGDDQIDTDPLCCDDPMMQSTYL